MSLLALFRAAAATPRAPESTTAIIAILSSYLSLNMISGIDTIISFH
jgi:hypothetical protein